MKFRVWATVVEAFDYCWRERRAMVHFGWIPVGITLAVAILLQIYGIDKSAVSAGTPDLRASGAIMLTGLIQTLVYLSVSVTWYQKVVLGDSAARRRPVFTFGRLELRMLGWQFAAIGVFLVVIVIGALIISALYGALTAAGQAVAANVLVIVLGLALGLGVCVAAMRFAMIVVLVALDKPVALREAWRMTAGAGWRLVGAMILVMLAGAVLALVSHLLALLVGMIGGIIASVPADKIAPYVSLVTENLIGFLLFLVLATVFGMVYRMLTDNAVATETVIETSFQEVLENPEQ